MEQRIRFCTSADGTRIAYATYGEPGGRPILITHAWTVVQEITGSAAPIKYYEELTSDRQLIAFDRRGIGASQRDVVDVGLAAQLADLAAIADDAGFETFDMAGMVDGAAVAAVYAARHPERIARLALAWAYARGEEVIRPERARTIAALIREDWSLGRRALADLFVVEASIGARRQFSDMLRNSVSAEIAARYIEYFYSLDIRNELMELRTPTLIVQHPQVTPAWRTAAMSVTSLIPGARLVAIEGRSELAHARVQRQFFAEGSESSTAGTLPSGTAVILFADIVDSTALTERLGDDAFREKARGLDEAMRAAIRDNGGSPVEGKTLGDGVLAVFTSAKQAIACAQACHEAASAAGLSLHAGIHAGDVIREADNVYGGAVNIAARVAAASAPGETLVSGTVRDLARTSAGVTFEDRGEQALKGIDDPVRVFAVRQA
jgi:class 3 adenylate cyclase